MAEKAKCVVCGVDISDSHRANGVCGTCYDSEIKCPVCGQYSFEEWGDFDICDVCGWENDPLQHTKPEYRAGANKMSLIEARKAYREGRPIY